VGVQIVRRFLHILGGLTLIIIVMAGVRLGVLFYDNSECSSFKGVDIDAAVSDAQNAIAKGDFRLLAVNGYATEVPVPRNFGGAAPKSIEVSVIEGTSDAYSNPRCIELNDRARRYAEIYNKEILSAPERLK